MGRTDRSNDVWGLILVLVESARVGQIDAGDHIRYRWEQSGMDSPI